MVALSLEDFKNLAEKNPGVLRIIESKVEERKKQNEIKSTVLKDKNAEQKSSQDMSPKVANPSIKVVGADLTDPLVSFSKQPLQANFSIPLDKLQTSQNNQPESLISSPKKRGSEERRRNLSRTSIRDKSLNARLSYIEVGNEAENKAKTEERHTKHISFVEMFENMKEEEPAQDNAFENTNAHLRVPTEPRDKSYLKSPVHSSLNPERVSFLNGTKRSTISEGRGSIFPVDDPQVEKAMIATLEESPEFDTHKKRRTMSFIEAFGKAYTEAITRLANKNQKFRRFQFFIAKNRKKARFIRSVLQLYSMFMLPFDLAFQSITFVGGILAMEIITVIVFVSELLIKLTIRQ